MLKFVRLAYGHARVIASAEGSKVGTAFRRWVKLEEAAFHIKFGYDSRSGDAQTWCSCSRADQRRSHSHVKRRGTQRRWAQERRSPALGL